MTLKHLSAIKDGDLFQSRGYTYIVLQCDKNVVELARFKDKKFDDVVYQDEEKVYKMPFKGNVWKASKF